MKKQGIWRHPPEESGKLYPGLVVHDNRVTGSITVGATRWPLWCFMGHLVRGGWKEVADDWPDTYGWTADKMTEFLYCLMEARGEFGRLLLVLADVERRECNRSERNVKDDRPWYEIKGQRARVVRQLRRCLGALDAEALEAVEGE